MNTEEFFTISKSFSVSFTDVKSSMNSASSWETRYRNIMLLGKHLKMMPSQWQTDTNKVAGCESNVWLIHGEQNDHHYFVLWSDSKIVKGLIAILLSLINGKTQQQIEELDLVESLNSLGVGSQLSASRTNGLNAIMTQIKSSVKTTK